MYCESESNSWIEFWLPTLQLVATIVLALTGWYVLYRFGRKEQEKQRKDRLVSAYMEYQRRLTRYYNYIINDYFTIVILKLIEHEILIGDEAVFFKEQVSKNFEKYPFDYWLEKAHFSEVSHEFELLLEKGYDKEVKGLEKRIDDELKDSEKGLIRGKTLLENSKMKVEFKRKGLEKGVSELSPKLYTELMEELASYCRDYTSSQLDEIWKDYTQIIKERIQKL